MKLGQEKGWLLGAIVYSLHPSAAIHNCRHGLHGSGHPYKPSELHSLQKSQQKGPEPDITANPLLTRSKAVRKAAPRASGCTAWAEKHLRASGSECPRALNHHVSKWQRHPAQGEQSHSLCSPPFSPKLSPAHCCNLHSPASKIAIYPRISQSLC